MTPSGCFIKVLNTVWRLLNNMAWVKDVLEGAQYVMETINMIMFIYEESTQMSQMALGTALQNGKLGLADKIYNETLLPSQENLFSFIIMYALLSVPSWTAFYSFFYMSRGEGNRLGGRLADYKKLQALGIQPGSSGWKARY